MDDADGGRRGLRARPGPGLLQALRDHWGLGWFAKRVDLGGSSSLNLLVGETHRRYVVRVHRPHVTPERLGAIHQARGVLLAGGVPCAPLVQTLRGAPWISLQGRLVEVEAYVDHDAVMDSWERLEVGMALLAQTHNLLRHVEVGLASRLPRQLVHGDFWDNNVLFRHGRPVLLADFDFMGERARVDDLALTLHCARSDLSTHAGPAQDRAQLRRLVASYDAGLDLPLSAAERAALPVAMARQPLSSIGGWVARLDDQAAARRHTASVGPELQASLRIMTELRRWRDAFA